MEAPKPELHRRDTPQEGPEVEVEVEGGYSTMEELSQKSFGNADFLRDELVRIRTSHAGLMNELMSNQTVLDEARDAKRELAEALCNLMGAPDGSTMEGLLLRKKLAGNEEHRNSAITALQEMKAAAELVGKDSDQAVDPQVVKEVTARVESTEAGATAMEAQIEALEERVKQIGAELSRTSS